MELLPLEIMAFIFHFLDVRGLIKLSYVSHLFHNLTKKQLQWVRLCFTDPQCQPLINAAMLQGDLLSCKIDAKFLYENINNNDVNKIQSLLFAKDVRTFILFVPAYEKGLPTFFPTPNDPRKLYFTEEAAKKKTRNASNVKSWLRVKVPVAADTFETLYQTQVFQYKEGIPKEVILFNTPQPIITSTFERLNSLACRELPKIFW